MSGKGSPNARKTPSRSATGSEATNGRSTGPSTAAASGKASESERPASTRNSSRGGSNAADDEDAEQRSEAGTYDEEESSDHETESEGESDGTDGQDELDEYADESLPESRGRSTTGATSSKHCTLCQEPIEAEKYKKCVYGHKICFSCFGLGTSELEPWNDGSQALSSNTCVVCQRDVLDKQYEIDGYPPRFLKFYLIRKLLEEDPPLCDVCSSHKPGQIRSVFFCIDCDVHACRDCLMDHLDGGDKSSHNLLNLLRAAYKSEKLFCFECHVNEAVSYCPKDSCDYPLCANCTRDKHRFHGAFNLSESQRNMLIFINRQRVLIREYREGVDFELERRRELRESKQLEIDLLFEIIKETADRHRKMIEEDEQKLMDIVTKHKNDVFAVYDVIDLAVHRKDIILKYFEVIHTRLREKKMDDERRIDAFSFCRENDNLLKTHKELHQKLALKVEAELSTLKFTPRQNVEKFREAGNNILGDIVTKERKVDPDRLLLSTYVTSIDVRGRNDRIRSDITCIRFLEGTDKLALVDSFNASIKIISKYNKPLHDKDPDIRIDTLGDKKIMSEGDRVFLEWNIRDQLLIVCNSSDYRMYVYSLDGKRVWSYDLPPGAGAAISLYHSPDGQLYVGRNHMSVETHGGILEIHMMLQKGR